MHNSQMQHQGGTEKLEINKLILSICTEPEPCQKNNMLGLQNGPLIYVYFQYFQIALTMMAE